MRRSNPEVEATIPRISPHLFTSENSARELLLDSRTHLAIMELPREWKVVGWALAKDVIKRDLCLYVVMSQNPDGERLWCHVSNHNMDKIAEMIKNDPSKIAL